MTSKTSTDPSVTRVTALWALSEITLGGVLHALRIPLTGLFVGSTALACIYLIAIFTNSYKSVFKSLIAVSAIKVMSSPQASPFSYLAMSVQSLCCMPLAGPRGQSRRWVTAMLVTASLYSPLQKLVLLYIAFGHEGMFAVLEELRNWLAPQLSTAEFVVVPLILWVSVHLLAGVLLAEWLHGWSAKGSGDRELLREWRQFAAPAQPKVSEVQAFQWRRFAFTGLVVVSLVLLYYFDSSLPKWFQFLWRPLLIILCWQLALRPLIYILSRKWGKWESHDTAVREIVGEFPRMWSILSFAQQRSAGVDGWHNRAGAFLGITFKLTVTSGVEAGND